MHKFRQAIGKLKERLFLLLPSDNHNLYRYCRYYVDRYQGKTMATFGPMVSSVKYRRCFLLLECCSMWVLTAANGHR